MKEMERLLKKNGIKETNISAAGGPCLARGLANRVHTSVVFANTDINKAISFSKLLSTDYYHIHVSNDVVGVEICAAIKNIFSMVMGASVELCNTTTSNQQKEKNYLKVIGIITAYNGYIMYTCNKVSPRKQKLFLRLRKKI